MPPYPVQIVLKKDGRRTRWLIFHVFGDAFQISQIICRPHCSIGFRIARGGGGGKKHEIQGGASGGHKHKTVAPANRCDVAQ